jgi:hypothetical protein
MSDQQERRRHWNTVYASRASESVSWFQSRPATSLELIDAAGAGAGT